MLQKHQCNAGFLKDLEIEEVSSNSLNPSNGQKVIYSGTVENWQTQVLESSERRKARPYLMGIVMAVWAVSVIASAFGLMVTGNAWLAVPSALISPPVCIVLKFYFKGG